MAWNPPWADWHHRGQQPNNNGLRGVWETAGSGERSWELTLTFPPAISLPYICEQNCTLYQLSKYLYSYINFFVWVFLSQITKSITLLISAVLFYVYSLPIFFFFLEYCSHQETLSCLSLSQLCRDFHSIILFLCGLLLSTCYHEILCAHCWSGDCYENKVKIIRTIDA